MPVSVCITRPRRKHARSGFWLTAIGRARVSVVTGDFSGYLTEPFDAGARLAEVLGRTIRGRLTGGFEGAVTHGQRRPTTTND